jgi:hypothetical protein
LNARATPSQVQATGLAVAAPTITGVNFPSTATQGTPFSYSAAATDRWTTLTSSWTFGDGTSGPLSGTKTYSSPGTFSPVLTVSDPFGNEATVTKSIMVSAPTATEVTSSQNPSVFGQSVTFTATVSPVVPGTGTPTGTVTFLLDGSQVGTGTLSGGAATFTTSALTAGNHTITTSYAGAGDFTGSSGSLTGNPQVVTPAPLTITASSASMTYGGSVPQITPSYAGFVDGDSASSLSTPPTCTTAVTSASNVGTYPTSGRD